LNINEKKAETHHDTHNNYHNKDKSGFDFDDELKDLNKIFESPKIIHNYQQPKQQPKSHVFDDLPKRIHIPIKSEADEAETEDENEEEEENDNDYNNKKKENQKFDYFHKSKIPVLTQVKRERSKPFDKIEDDNLNFYNELNFLQKRQNKLNKLRRNRLNRMSVFDPFQLIKFKESDIIDSIGNLKKHNYT